MSSGRDEQDQDRDREGGYEHEATPVVSELEVESAILKGVTGYRPGDWSYAERDGGSLRALLRLIPALGAREVLRLAKAAGAWDVMKLAVDKLTPVGRHKHVLIIALQADVHSQTGIWVPVPSIWKTLEEHYDLEALDNMTSSTPSLPDSPDPLSPIPDPRRRRPHSLSPLSSPPPSPGPSRSARVIDSPHFRSVFELPLGSGREMIEDGEGNVGEDMGFRELVYARAKGVEEDWGDRVKEQMSAVKERERRESSPLSSASVSAEVPKRRGKRNREGSEEEKPTRKSRRR